MAAEKSESTIREVVLQYYPEVQGIYLFGTHGTEDERPDSDVDIGLLLPVEQAKHERNLGWSACRLALEDALHKQIDLLNVREVSTVLQKEIVHEGNLIHAADQFAVDEFEMLVLSYYQKLNEERTGIIEEAMNSRRFYQV